VEEGPDMRFWTGDPHGIFTISSAYKLLCGFHNMEADNIWKKIWKLSAILLEIEILTYQNVVFIS
jgi:hypothetical protein